MEFVPGDLINARYRLVDVIGHGGMGTVWRAHDEMLDREIAIKEVRPPEGLHEDERSELNALAMQEARATARLSHPGIVTIFDVIDHDGVPIIVMELIKGHSLAEILREQVRLPYRRVAEIGAALLDALREAHAAGIVHRDLKPANVLISERRVLITDFGVAQRTGQPADPEEITGTPSFMAPEQAENAAASPAADLWALGATLFNAVEGRPPFQGQDAPSVLLTLLTQDAPAPRNAGPLAPLITALLSKDPSRRPTADEAAAELDAILHGAKPAPVTSPAARPSPSPASKPGSSIPSRSGRPKSGRVLLAGVVLAGLFGLVGALVSTMRAPSGGHPSGGPTDFSTDLPDGFGDLGLSLYRVTAFSPDGRIVAFGGNPGAIQLYDASSHRFLRSLEKDDKIDRTVETLEFSPDGRSLAAGLQYGSDVTVWNIAKERDRTLPGRGHLLRFGSQGRTLTTVDAQGTVTVWTLRSAEHTSSRIPTGGGCFRTALSPNGDEVACGTENGTVIILNTTTHKRATLRLSHRPDGLAFTPDGRSLAVTSDADEYVRIFDIASHRRTAELRSDSFSMEGALAFSPDGKTLAIPSYDPGSGAGTVEIWNVVTAMVTATLQDGEEKLHDLEFSPDGRTLAIAGEDRGGQLWDVRSPRRLASWRPIA